MDPEQLLLASIDCRMRLSFFHVTSASYVVDQTLPRIEPHNLDIAGIDELYVVSEAIATMKAALHNSNT